MRKIIFYIILSIAILSLPAIFVVGFFEVTSKMSKVVYHLTYCVDAESSEPFRNLTVLLPAAQFNGSMPENFKTVKMGNKTYIELHRTTPYRTSISGKVKYGMSFWVDSPVILENASMHKEADRIFVSFENASYVKIDVALMAVGERHLYVFGRDIYIPYEALILTIYKISVNVSEEGVGWDQIDDRMSTSQPLM